MILNLKINKKNPAIKAEFFISLKIIDYSPPICGPFTTPILASMLKVA